MRWRFLLTVVPLYPFAGSSKEPPSRIDKMEVFICQKNANQSKQYRIYIKESKSWVAVNKEFYTNYYRDINSYQMTVKEA